MNWDQRNATHENQISNYEDIGKITYEEIIEIYSIDIIKQTNIIRNKECNDKS